MRKKVLMLLSAMFCLSLAVANAVEVPADFIKEVAKIRQEAVNQASNPAIVSAYEVMGNSDAPTKVKINMKKGDRYVISFANATNRTRNDYFVMANAKFMSGSTRVPFSESAYKAVGNVQFRVYNRRYPITYKGKKLIGTPVRATVGSTMLFTAVRDQELSFDLMYSGKENAEATLQVIKVTDPKAIDLLEAKYPTEVATYIAFIGNNSNASTLLSASTLSNDQYLANRIISKLKNKAPFQTKLNAINNLKTPAEKVEAYFKLFYEAKEVYDLQQQLVWVKQEAIDLAFDNLKKKKGFDTAKYQPVYKELSSLIKAGYADMYTSEAGVAKAKKILALQKTLLTANPAFNFDKILVGKYNIGASARRDNASRLGTPRNNWSNQLSADQTGFDAEIGYISDFKTCSKFTKVYKPNNTSSVPDLRLNYDGDKVLFSMVVEGDRHWQVHELDLKNGKVEQITTTTKEEAIDHFDASYLPEDGKILTTTNVGGNGVPCVNGADQVGGLTLYDRKTDNFRRLTFDQDANWGPTMMHNGKVMYTRWEYTDLMHYYSRFVMSMNPDGTEQKGLFGSGMTFPNATFDIQCLPDHPSRFVGIVSGHHGTARSGRLFIYDPAISRTSIDGMVHEIPHRGRKLVPIVKDQLVDGVYPQFIKPYPVDNDNFLVTARLQPEGLWGIYLVDTFDNMTLLYEIEGGGVIHATPIRKTKKQPIIPSKVDLSDKQATVFIQDVYEGIGTKGVPRGTIKQIRVHSYEYAYIKSPSNMYAMGVESGWDIKTCLGIVDVEEDGSVMFKIPANTPVSLHLLDSEGCSIQWFRSWLTGMPGEVVSCVGCHEDQNQIPAPKSVMAMKGKAKELTAPEGGIRPFTFADEIQPILDRACISCHGEGKKIDFRSGRKRGLYTMAHLALHPYVHRQGPESAAAVLIPYEYHANVSPLVQILKNGHYGVELTDKEWRTLYMWIDYNVPDMGVFRITDSDLFPNQYERRIYINNKYGNGAGYDWKKHLADFQAWRAKQPKPEPAKFEFKEPKFKEVKVKGFPRKVEKGETKVVDLGGGVKMTFVKIPKGKFIMGENKINSNAAPAVAAEVKKDFWISETELSNAQVRAFIPEHSSRFYDQQWKDHTKEGYEANLDEQVAIRLSWYQATDIAKKMSAKTGLNVLLPTEEQWEYVARSGSDKDYWFSTTNTWGDFSKKENLSDEEMTKMAVEGVDPHPMAKTNGNYIICNFRPKDESVNDGHMLTSNPDERYYDANGYGVRDMLGNVSEWTRSDFKLHDAKEAKQEFKVVKGGAWNTHPKDARAARRLAFYPWQAPYNVGMRLVIED